MPPYDGWVCVALCISQTDFSFRLRGASKLKPMEVFSLSVKFQNVDTKNAANQVEERRVIL